MAADRRAAARAVRHDLVALVEQVLVPDLPQQPPDRLDVVVGVGVVGVVQVDPEADALGEALPLLEVRGDALAAQLVELGDAVGLDLPLAVDAEAALDLELDRQAVRVPAGLARHAVAAHRLVAREEVLEDARDDVVRARPAVGRGRPLVEHEDGGVLAALEALLEDAVLLPELEDARVERREVDARRDVLEPGLTVYSRDSLSAASGRIRATSTRARAQSSTGWPAWPGSFAERPGTDSAPRGLHHAGTGRADDPAGVRQDGPRPRRQLPEGELGAGIRPADPIERPADGAALHRGRAAHDMDRAMDAGSRSRTGHHRRRQRAGRT